MTNTIREVVYSIRHHGCPVSDASAAVPAITVSTISKIEKEDQQLESLLHLDGSDGHVAAYINQLQAHDVPTRVRPFRTEKGSDETYIVLTVEYSDALTSIANIFSNHDCFQPTSVTVKRGFENWSVYHEESVDIDAVTEELRDQGVTFDVQRNVGVTALPESQLTVTGNETQGLTARQLEVLTTARQMGYYDNDRAVTMEDIAAAMDLTSATICEHLNRAENHVISAAIDAVSPADTDSTDQSLRTAPDGSP